MVRTCSRLGNSNKDQQLEPQRTIESASKVMTGDKPITMAGVQAMMWAMLVERMEETRQMLQENRREVIAPIIEPHAE